MQSVLHLIGNSFFEPLHAMIGLPVAEAPIAIQSRKGKPELRLTSLHDDEII